MKKYVVYCATNTVNGKRYVGLTSVAVRQRAYKHTFKARRGSQLAFHVALREFGEEAFVWEKVADAGCDLERAWEIEREWIIKLNARVRDGTGYNTITWGPDADPVPAERRARMASAKRKSVVKSRNKTDRKGSAQRKARLSATNQRKLKADEIGLIPYSHYELLAGWRANGAKLKQLAALYGSSNSAMCAYLRRHGKARAHE